MDKIFIKNIEVETIIGIFEWEREVKQSVFIDIEIDLNLQKSGATDKISNSLDYKKISKRIINFTIGSKFKLIESLADKIAKIVLNEFNVKRVSVSVKKQGALRGSELVGVNIVRP